MIHVGAWAMYLISRRLSKRHNIKENPRESLYDSINTWLAAVEARGSPFMGGHSPDLSDLAVYGVLGSMEGCQAFQDALDNTELKGWYYAVKEKVKARHGSTLIN